jgi:hypothetical protein
MIGNLAQASNDLLDEDVVGSVPPAVSVGEEELRQYFAGGEGALWVGALRIHSAPPLTLEAMAPPGYGRHRQGHRRSLIR